MEQYNFDANHSKEIVNAIVEGYRNYVEHRRDRHEKMKISSAFAWTKGNFIESQIAEVSSDLNLSYKKAKAGLTWDYLQFIHGDTKKLFLIKNAAYFNENNFSQAVLPNKDRNQGLRRTYLHELSKINQSLEFPAIQSNHENKIKYSEQLSFFVSGKQVKGELDQFKSSYNEFHILTYEIDATYQISKIAHYLPNPDNNMAYMVEDLSKYISGAALTDNERKIVAPEPDDGLIDPRDYDIGIFEDEENK
ncbi:hypothetical protein KFZ58_18610 [Virgibacillus sp. NKC19-16]|uniref:spr1630 family ClpXP-sensitive toxin n=1 Tax=Virgibacillus salidurans TaxID=2831673 RepID=UPI001F2646A0|nr:hypothetical protein [Virgibacillus sp. NKC19-16]UJL46330.1 hypothetical protein KFZ58_18610 [Virgibacillus sp. NKC19-16]